MEEFAEDEAIIAAGPSPQNSSDDSDESDDGRSDLSMSHYDSHIERLVGELENGKEEAAIDLYRLTDDAANLAAIAAAGAIPPLLALRGQEWVASTLKNLAQDDTICTAIAEALVELARSGETEGQESAAAALRDLFYEFATEIAAAAGGVEALVVALVINGTADGEEASDSACDVLRNLARNATNRAAIVERLVGFLSRGAARDRKEAARALWHLAFNGPRKEAAANKVAIANAGAIPPLVAIVRNGPDGGQEDAAWVLGDLADNDPICTAIIEAGAVEALVALATNDEADGQEAAARALRNLARSNRVAIKKLLVLRALVTCGRAETTSRTAPSIKWLLGAGSLALPNELIREILKFWRATPIRAWYPS